MIHGDACEPESRVADPSAGDRAAPGVVPATASRTVLAVGANVAALVEPCLAVACEGVLLAFACRYEESDAAMRLAARIARRGAVALPLWEELGEGTLGERSDPVAAAAAAADATTATEAAAGREASRGAAWAEAMAARVVEEFGRLDGVLAVVGEGGSSGVGFAEADLYRFLRAVAPRLGRGEPRIQGRFVAVWRGEPSDEARMSEILAERVGDGSCPGAGRRWQAHALSWPAAAGELAGLLGSPRRRGLEQGAHLA